MADLLSDAHITQIREQLARETLTATSFIGLTRNELRGLLALVDQLSLERDEARAAYTELDQIDERLTQQLADERDRAVKAEAACARLRTALGSLRREVVGVIGYAENDLRAVLGVTNVEVLKLRAREAYLAEAELEAALALPDDGAESLTQEEKR